MASSHGDAIEFSLRNSPTGREPGFTGVIAVADAGGVPGVVFRVPAGIAGTSRTALRVRDRDYTGDVVPLM